ncbi:hypothetical protein Tco_0559025, partial [Tanacetum coccineum]
MGPFVVDSKCFLCRSVTNKDSYISFRFKLTKIFTVISGIAKKRDEDKINQVFNHGEVHTVFCCDIFRLIIGVEYSKLSRLLLPREITKPLKRSKWCEQLPLKYGSVFRQCHSVVDYEQQIPDVMNGFDLLALVVGFTLVDVNKRLLESLVLRESLCLEILLEDVTGSSCKREEDVATYHLSRLKNSYLEMLIEREIADEFPDKHIMLLKSKFNDDELWYADFVKYIVGNVVPPNWTFEKRKSETLKILAHCHSGLAGGHHSANVTAKKVYESGFYWPSVFKDANEY